MDDYGMGLVARAGAAFAADKQTGQIASGRSVGEMPPMRERLHEIEKLLADATNTVRGGADRLFGAQLLAGSVGENSPPREVSISDLLGTILNQARELHGEASRLGRIG